MRRVYGFGQVMCRFEDSPVLGEVFTGLRPCGEQVEMEWMSFRKHNTTGEQVEMDLDVILQA